MSARGGTDPFYADGQLYDRLFPVGELERGEVHVDVAETYDPVAQVTRGTWFFSTEAEADFVVVPLEIRSIFPQEMPLLLELGGLRIVERFGDWSSTPLTPDATLQVYVCEAG